MPGTPQELKTLVSDAMDIEAWARKQKGVREAAAEKKSV
jgi:hypothetical protein